MAFTLDRVVPWGRSFAEYCRMFALTDRDLACRLVGCADGPASFNAEAAARGHRVVSCDPVYRFSCGELATRVDATCERIVEVARQNASEFVWDRIVSPEELGRIRREAMQEFLDDFPQGKQQGRYVAAGLPRLPFSDGAFEIALCSHFLLLYSQQLSIEFHVEAIAEMGRVAREVRIFPLLSLGSVPSGHVRPVCARLRARGFQTTIQEVDYEFQRGGNPMLRVRRWPRRLAYPVGDNSGKFAPAAM